MKKNTLLIIFIILLIFTIYQQVRIVNIVIDKESILDAEPLSYGASKYGITNCTCKVNDNTFIYFDANSSKTIRNTKKPYNLSNYLNNVTS
jgi:hypothetical protein